MGGLGVEQDGGAVDGPGDVLVQLAEGVVVQEAVGQERDAVEGQGRPDEEVQRGEQAGGEQVGEARGQVAVPRPVVVHVEPVVQAQRQGVPGDTSKRERGDTSLSTQGRLVPRERKE